MTLYSAKKFGTLFDSNISLHRGAIFDPIEVLGSVGMQQLVNLEIPVLVRSLKSINAELAKYLDGKLFNCCLSVTANP